MVDLNEDSINLRALKKIDENIREILLCAGQVAVYLYDQTSNSKDGWQKKNVEGTLFMVRGIGQLEYGFVVINRLNTINFVQKVTKDLEINVQNQFLMYKNEECDIYCIWFYDVTALLALKEKLISTINRMKKGAITSSSPQISNKPNGNSNITSEILKKMLSLDNPNNNNDNDIPNLIETKLSCKEVLTNSFKKTEPIFINGRRWNTDEEAKEPSLDDLFRAESFEQESNMLNVPNGEVNKVNKSHKTKGSQKNKANTLSDLMKTNWNTIQSAEETKPWGKNWQNKILRSSLPEVMQKLPFPTQSPSGDAIKSINNELDEDQSSIEHDQSHLRDSPPDSFSKCVTPKKLISNESSDNNPLYLSMEQLKQTMIYLLKNNADFLHAIHTAYVENIKK